MMPWDELKQKILELPQSDRTHFRLSGSAVITDEELFIKSHIAAVEAFPRKPNMTQAEKNARLYIAKPHYDRLYAYYLLASNF